MLNLRGITGFVRDKWFAGIKPRKVSPAAARQLALVRTPDNARQFLETARLEVITVQEHPTAFSVKIASPQVVLSNDNTSTEYFFPQVLLPRLTGEFLPYGTVLLNMLFPHIGEDASPETDIALMQNYGDTAGKLAFLLGARPFAFITGTKGNGSPLPLSDRGFRLFFSSVPEKLYPRIEAILEAWRQYEAELNKRSRSVQLQSITQLTSCGPSQHSILADVKPYTGSTMLVDMR